MGFTDRLFGSEVRKLRERRDVEGLINLLLKRHRESNFKKIDRQIVSALAEIGEQSVKPLLKGLIHRPEGIDFGWDIAMLEATNNVLERVGNRATEILINALNDKDMNVRAGTAFVLGKRGDSEAVLPLIQALKYDEGATRTDDEATRMHAVAALLEMKDERVVEPLIQALTDEYSNVRFWAALALGNIRNQRAVEQLIETVGDKEHYVRCEAAKALGNIGDARAIVALIGALYDEYNNVRKAAADALGKMGDARAVEPLTHLLSDQWWFVREAAKRALDKITRA